MFSHSPRERITHFDNAFVYIIKKTDLKKKKDKRKKRKGKKRKRKENEKGKIYSAFLFHHPGYHLVRISISPVLLRPHSIN